MMTPIDMLARGFDLLTAFSADPELRSCANY
jgi:hypothetical protein